MNRCSKTGLTDTNFRTILDVLNMYDPNDNRVCPAMTTPEFMQDVNAAFKAVLAHVNRTKYNSDLGASAGQPVREAEKPEPVDDMSLSYQQYIHDNN
ncbi:hypothetical protein OAU81_00645 [bacterium]|nr:hypothetical protein [bacterium]